MLKVSVQDLRNLNTSTAMIRDPGECEDVLAWFDHSDCDIRALAVDSLSALPPGAYANV